MARPSECTPAIVQIICDDLKEGVPLAEICRRNNMPDASTVYDWMDADEDVHQAIARARVTGFDAIAVEALKIADDSSGDYVEDAEGRMRPNTEHIQRSKLRVETRLKLLAKWDPKRYGDLLMSPQTTVNVGVNIGALSEDRRQELLKKKRDSVERQLRDKKIVTLELPKLNGNGNHR